MKQIISANMILEIIFRILNTGTDARFTNAIADVVTIACLCASLTTGSHMLNEARSNEHRAQTDD